MKQKQQCDEGVKALTIHQPWASLIALGAKTIETRAWPAPEVMIGQRLLIHAAKRAMDADGLKLSLDHLHALSLPRGAVVASCILDACVPILGVPPFEAEGVVPDCVVAPDNGTRDRPRRLRLWRWHAASVPRAITGWDGLDIEVQRPFGDFTPGRWAWLLSDVEPTTERCPRCWGTGGGPAWADRLGRWEDFCPTCGGQGDIDGRVPMRGRQRLWTPDWPSA